MKTTTIISGAAIVLSTISSAAPTPSTNISKRTVQTEERRTAEANAEAATDVSAPLEKKEANEETTIEVLTDDEFAKRQTNTTTTTGEGEEPDACIVM